MFLINFLLTIDMFLPAIYLRVGKINKSSVCITASVIVCLLKRVKAISYSLFGETISI